MIWKEKSYDIETLCIGKVLNKENFYGKNLAENVRQKLVPDPCFILVNKPKQPWNAKNYFRNKVFWKSIIKEP